MSESNDKIYIIIILLMIGYFIYWYQSKDHTRCPFCKEKKEHKKHISSSKKQKSKKRNSSSKKNKNHVEFVDNESDVSLESLDNSDNIMTTQSKKTDHVVDDNNDSESLDI